MHKPGVTQVVVTQIKKSAVLKFRLRWKPPPKIRDLLDCGGPRVGPGWPRLGSAWLCWREVIQSGLEYVGYVCGSRISGGMRRRWQFVNGSEHVFVSQAFTNLQAQRVILNSHQCEQLISVMLALSSGSRSAA